VDCVRLGYGDDRFGRKAYRLKTKFDGKILFSRDIKFDETPANCSRQVFIEASPRPAEKDTESEGEMEDREEDEGRKATEGDQQRLRSTSEERDISA
jgi:hypothetical protein